MSNRKQKKKIIKIKLSSTESSYFYTTIKNKKTKKIKIKKYDPKIKKHVTFIEKKINE